MCGPVELVQYVLYRIQTQTSYEVCERHGSQQNFIHSIFSRCLKFIFLLYMFILYFFVFRSFLLAMFPARPRWASPSPANVMMRAKRKQWKSTVSWKQSLCYWFMVNGSSHDWLILALGTLSMKTTFTISWSLLQLQGRMAEVKGLARG